MELVTRTRRSCLAGVEIKVKIEVEAATVAILAQGVRRCAVGRKLVWSGPVAVGKHLLRRIGCMRRSQ